MRPLIATAMICAAVGGCAPEASVQYQESEQLAIATARVPMAGGLTEPVSIDVPVGTESLLIEVNGEGGHYFLSEMLTPMGADLVEAASVVTRDARETPGFVSWGYPAGDESGVAAGPYQLLIRGETPDGHRLEQDSLTIRVYMRKHSALARCVLPLDFIVATDAIAAEDVDESIERLALGVADLFAPVGVTIPQYGVSQAHFPTMTIEEEGDLTEVSATVGSVLWDALDTGRARNEAIHVFIVRSMGSGLNGYSMGLPGPVSGDWPSSAVLVSTTQFSTGNVLDPEAMAVSTAHEIGHYLGLYHTSERSMFHDPISDTPECDGEQHCLTEDFVENLMTPGGNPDRHILTPGQGSVMRRHPLCR